MDKIKIEELISFIPPGKKRKYLSNNYINGLINYFEGFRNEDLDLDEIIVNNFRDIILSNNNLVENLKLFCESELLKIINNVCNEQTVELSKKKIRKILIEYYNLEIEKTTRERRTLELLSICNAPLHDFQERIRRKVINLMFRGEKKFLIHMPTGSGKTRTAAEIIIDFIRFHSSSTLLNERLKIIWVAQSGELCGQAFETVKYLFNTKGTSNISFGHFYGENDLDSSIIESPAIIFASIQKLLLNYKEPLWEKIRNDNYLVVVDEAHRSVASEWVKALDFFTKNKSVNLIGLTATPGSGSSQDSIVNYGLSKYYNNNKITLLDSFYSPIKKPIEYLVKKEFLADIIRNDIESDVLIPNGISSSDFGKLKIKKTTLNQLSYNANRNATILNIIKKHYEENHKILIFTCGTDHNNILKTLLEIDNIPSEIIDTKTNNDRDSIVNEFKNGKLNILLNYGVLTTGFDAPKTNVCIIARPVESIVMYSQMVGRILRGPRNGSGNKKNNLYTIKDNLNHGDYDKLFNTFNDFWN
jgi:superfamily II DNA or RNA helicase